METKECIREPVSLTVSNAPAVSSSQCQGVQVTCSMDNGPVTIPTFFQAQSSTSCRQSQQVKMPKPETTTIHNSCSSSDVEDIEIVSEQFSGDEPCSPSAYAAQMAQMRMRGYDSSEVTDPKTLFKIRWIQQEKQLEAAATGKKNKSKDLQGKIEETLAVFQSSDETPTMSYMPLGPRGKRKTKEEYLQRVSKNWLAR